MDQGQALARVGLPDPSGDPQRLADSAQGWQDLSTHLQQQSEWLTTLRSQSEQVWHGAGGDAFHERSRQLAANIGQVAQVAAQIAAQQQAHAEQHAKVLRIIKEIAIQIAITLVLLALSTIFPWLLAAAEAQIALLVVTGSRVIETLVDALAMLIRMLVRARTWLEELGKLAWNGKKFSIGYGRIIADGSRDFAIDLLANTTSTAALHKKLDAGQIFQSAAMSFGVGGLIGGLESSGTKFARTAAGDIKRDAAGRPQFVTFGDQLKKKVNSIGAKPAKVTTQSTENAAPGKVPLADNHNRAVFNRLKQAQGAAREYGLTGGQSEGKQLTRRMSEARQQHTAALARLGDAKLAHQRASALSQQSLDTMHHRTIDLRQAKADEQRALSSLHGLYHASRNKPWSRELEQQYQDLQAQRIAAVLNYQTASNRLADAELAHARAVQNRTASEQTSRRATDAAAESRRQLEQAQAQMAAQRELIAAREAVLQKTSKTDQLRDEWKTNAWRQGYPTRFTEIPASGGGKLKSIAWEKVHSGGFIQALKGFGSPKTWQEVFFYDTVKDGSKGAIGSAAQDGVGVAEGNVDPSNIWRDTLFGAAGGSVRGIANGRTSNVLYPKNGIEEILWKSGTKSLDKTIRENIETEVDKPANSGSRQHGQHEGTSDHPTASQS